MLNVVIKKMTCEGTSRQVLICLRPPPLLGFCLGWCNNFVGSESGQKQSVKLLQNMVSNTIQQRIIYLKYFLVFSFIEKRPFDYYPVQDSFDRFCSSIFGFLLYSLEKQKKKNWERWTWYRQFNKWWKSEKLQIKGLLIWIMFDI